MKYLQLLHHKLHLETKYPWPDNGIKFNKWYLDAAAFVAQIDPNRWLKDWRFKYLNVTIDTRNMRFVVTDRDNKLASPDEALNRTPATGTLKEG